jgi:hypothetical protein
VESTVPVTLPGGYWLDGSCYREVELRPLNSSDEVFVVEAGEALSPARRTTALLSRCLERLGPLESPVGAEQIGSLTVGDREALLLHLRRLTLGEKVRCVLSCPELECGEKLDLDLDVGELLLPPYPYARRHYETTVAENGTSYRVRFRLPTGADQESVETVARRDAGEAAGSVLERCVEDVVSEGGEALEDLPPIVAEQLPDVMADLDPQAELRLALTCPACRSGFSALLDAGTYFFQELEGETRHLYREVHTLALYYHWSEAEIMAMSNHKRGLYLGLLEEAFAEARSR